MKCSICGTENRDNVEYCRQCGVSIARRDAMPAPPAASRAVCLHCRRTHAVPARFCDQCGGKLPTQLDRSDEASRRGAAPPAERRPSVPDAPRPSESASPFLSTPAASEPASPGNPGVGQTDGTSTAVTVTAGMPARWTGAGLRRMALRHLGWGTLDDRQARRRLQLIAGLAAALAGIILSGFLMAQTLIVGAPPWQEPRPPALPDQTLLAAAERALQPESSHATPAPATPAPEPAQPVADRPIAGADAGAATPEQAPDAALAAPSEPQAGSASSGDGGSPGGEAALPSEPRLKMTRQRVPAMAAAQPPSVPSPSRSEKQAPETGEDTRASAPSPDAPRIARTERRSAQTAASPAWYASMKAQLNRCADEPNLFNRIVCAEKTKFRFCSPNRWGQVAECVKTEHRGVNDLHHLGGWLEEAPGMRRYASTPASYPRV